MPSAIYIYKGEPVENEESSDLPTNIQHVTLASHRVTAQAVQQNRTLLVSVGLPMGLKVIGELAFDHCTSLKTVEIPSSVHIIHHAAFRKCQSLETMDLPKGLKEIAAETFQHCKSLWRIHISSSVQDIGRNAFWGCKSLPHVDLPDGLLRIGTGVFAICQSLTRIFLPSTVVSIGSMAFSGCIALRSVEISISEDKNAGLQLIESFAFNICSNLMNIAVPKNCNMRSRAFRGCQHPVFDLDDCTLRTKLNSRFDHLPYHKVCYQQAHHGEKMSARFTSLANSNDENDKTKDIFGLSPFHILALSARPNANALQKLLEVTSPNGILRLDQSRATPLRYAVENFAPRALVFTKSLLHAMIDKRIDGLGLDVWKSYISQEIDSFDGKDVSERTQRVHKLFALLRLYERKEVLSLLELALWKNRMGTSKSLERAPKRIKVSDDVELISSQNGRQRSYLNSGAEIVIINILPYLGDIVKTLNF